MSAHSRTSVAIVTGCSSGIGRATAILLAERGWRVFATARRPETLNDIVSAHITPLRLDVTDEASRLAAVEQTLEQAGHIDALVNNAGYGEGGPLEEATEEEIRRQFETNTFGPLRLAQLVLPTMRAQRSGRIVNVSSINGRVTVPFTGLYSASKFALEALSDALRMETRPFGVHVIVVEPGGTRTNFNSATARHARRFATNTQSPYHRHFEAFTQLYRPIQDVQLNTPGGSIVSKLYAPPEIVAKSIHHALTAKHPCPRYAATPDAGLMLALLPWLPDRLRDALWGRLLGLRESRMV